MKKVFLFVLLVSTLLVCGCSRSSKIENDSFKDYGFERIGSYDSINFGEKGSISWVKGYPSREHYDEIIENAFINTQVKNDSYFSLDSFTASYSNMRRFINRGQMIPKNTIKVDELINYFKYDLNAVEDDQTFNVSSEIGVAPWNSDHHLVTIGVNTKEVEMKNDFGNNIVFLIDVSGSMGSDNKLPLVKKAFKCFVEALDPSDRVSIVTYASGVNTVVEGEYADNKEVLIEKVENLSSSGSTAGADGLERAYNICQKYFIPGGNNRIMIATDGDFNVGISSKDELEEFISEKAQSGIYLTCLGFGMGNYRDTTMETLAKNGNGGYAYIDSLEEAKKVLVDELDKTMVTVAKDVKSAVVFNKDAVLSYRLIGYENKSLTKDEFEDETKDAGEIGSGHQSIVCYEVVLDENYRNEDLFEVKINYKDPHNDESKTFEKSFKYNNETNSEDFKFVSCIIEFALVMMNSAYKENANYSNALERLDELSELYMNEFKVEFKELVHKALENNLVYTLKYPENIISIRVNTSYGMKVVSYPYDRILTTKTLIELIFGSTDDDKTYEIYLDSDYVHPFTDRNVTSDIVVYIK